ncbi:MAG: hypothetical protein QXF55_01035 [Candidatus Aenigmatarchaeota archaeon]
MQSQDYENQYMYVGVLGIVVSILGFITAFFGDWPFLLGIALGLGSCLGCKGNKRLVGAFSIVIGIVGIAIGILY